MKTYQIRIIETISKVVEVTANNAEDAEEMAMNMYNNEEVVLDYDDYDGVEFMNINDNE